jgi:outer membrane biosynthesis protein TonB
MPKDPPSQSYSENFRGRAGVASGHFWRNLTLIALAHVAVLLGLIRWSVEARSSSDAQSIVWISAAGDLAAGEPQSSASPSATTPIPAAESEPLKPDEAEKEEPVLTAAKSEIELPAPTPTPTSTPKPTVTPTPKPKATPKQTPKPKQKPAHKRPAAKASPKPSPKAKRTAKKSAETTKKAEAKAEKKKIAKAAPAKDKSSSQAAREKTSSADKGTRAGGLPAVASAKAGGSSESEFGWYGNMLHDRFYSAWIQPTTNVPSDAKISTLVKVRIEKDGRVSKFEIIKPSKNVVVNESVATTAKRVTHVDPPPAGLGNGDHYDVKINFELNTDEGLGNR